MPSEIAKILIRNGTNADRLNVVLSQAELGFTTDTTRLYIGDGTTIGGLVTSNKNWGLVANVGDLANLQAEVNDFAFYNSKTYTLTASPATSLGNWAIVAGQANGTVTTVSVGDYLNINGNPSVKSFTSTGSITLEINSLLEVMYPIGTVYTTNVGYIDATTSTSVFNYTGTAGQFNLISGSYLAGIWTYVGSSTIGSTTVYSYVRVS